MRTKGFCGEVYCTGGALLLIRHLAHGVEIFYFFFYTWHPAPEFFFNLLHLDLAHLDLDLDLEFF